MSATTDSSLTTVRALGRQHDFYAYVLPTGDYPVATSERERYLGILADSLETLDALDGGSPENLLQVWKLHHEGASKQVSINGRAWIPVTGVGVWPDREPPHVWTVEEFSQFEPGKVPRPPIFMVFRLKGAREQRENVLPLMGGRGAMIQAGVAGDLEAFYQQCSQYFRDFIVEPLHLAYPFFFPLLEAKTLPALSAEVSERVLGGLRYYVRESPEDNGVFILSRSDLGPAFRNLRWKIEELPNT